MTPEQRAKAHHKATTFQYDTSKYEIDTMCKVPNEKPILFNAEMVRAILDGRKTQTRRAVKNKISYAQVDPYPDYESKRNEPSYHIDGSVKRHPKPELVNHIKCPYGQVGDHLWVRETFRQFRAYDECGCSEAPCPCPPHGKIIYRSDDPNEPRKHRCEEDPKWKPSIHMPRWASRITLKITDIRVERLQDISVEASIAEGIKLGNNGWKNYAQSNIKIEKFNLVPQDSFISLWKSVNGAESWDANPWVWVIEFERLKP